MTDIAERLERGRKATSPDGRRKNVNTVKGLIQTCFVPANPAPRIYANHSTTDIDSAIRRSEVELADYELKQGLLRLNDDRSVDENLVDKVLKTICAMANNGPSRQGRLLIGVSDKEADTQRIKLLDGIDARKVGRRSVVGINREASKLQITTEAYVAKWKDAIKHSALSQALRDSVLSSIDYNSYYGLGVLVIIVPEQKELSYFGEAIYWRNGDSTELAATPQQIVNIAKRF